jgi:hypothetical protein
MSIASEISRLQTAKADMKTALEAKGVTVGTAKLDTYDTLISSISAGVDISDADAAVTDVVASKTFYATSGGKKTGTMVDRGTVSTDITTAVQEVTIAAGKHSGSGVVKISAAEQAKIIAGNIKKDIVVLGVTGTVESGAGGTYSKVVRILTSSGTWTKPTGLTHLEVVCIGGGGGGASGAKRASGVVSRGGGGGGAGSIAWYTLLASELSATENYTIGAGGAGGASQSTNTSANIAGSAGGDSFFGSFVLAKGGNGANNAGSGGGASSSISQLPSSNNPGGAGANSAANGSAGLGASQQSTTSGYYDTRGSGAGGGISTANAEASGGTGARYYNKSGTLSSLNGGEVATNGGDGVNYYMDRMPFIMGTEDTAYEDVTIGYGTPGGGGGSSTSGNAGRGGDGGLYGGAGGGGGSARNDVGNSGRGGNGAQGVIILIEHIVA